MNIAKGMNFLKKIRKEVLFLLLILGLSVALRIRTWNTEYVLTQADPWWFLRHTKSIVDNGFKPPKWDYLSHFPPGRPFPRWLFWEYFMVAIYALLGKTLTFIGSVNLAPVVMIVIGIASAYFFSKYIEDEIAGVLAAFMIAFSPTIMSVSMAGYIDTDSLVVTFTILSMFSLLYAYEKRTKLSIAMTIIINQLFIWGWIAGWYPSLLFTVFTAVMCIINYFKGKHEMIKRDIILLLTILIPLNIVSQVANLMNIVQFVIERTGWFTGEMIVNISVAEMQPIKMSDMKDILMTRVGILAAFGLPLYFFFTFKNLFSHGKISHREIFLLLWFFFMLVLISRGVRFTLLFTIPTVMLGSIGLSRAFHLAEKVEVKEIKILFVGILLTGVLYQFCLSTLPKTYGVVSHYWFDAMEWLKENADKNSLVITWWDPGHFIAYNTGLKVHADGAHCPSYDCPIYDHNNRIRAMGRIFSTTNETEAIEIINKYVGLSDEQCRKEKEKFPFMPDDACKNVTEVYLISSKDLIGKFIWINYFGGYEHELKRNMPKEEYFGVCQTPDGFNVYCMWMFGKSEQSQNTITYRAGNLRLTLLLKNNKIYPIMMIPGERFLVKKLLLYDLNNRPYVIDLSHENTTIDKLGGMAVLDKSYILLYYVPEKLVDSIFVRTFFLRQDLDHFKLVYENPELVIYKVIL